MKQRGHTGEIRMRIRANDARQRRGITLRCREHHCAGAGFLQFRQEAFMHEKGDRSRIGGFKRADFIHLGSLIAQDIATEDARYVLQRQ